MTWSSESAKAYLARIIDGEGCIQGMRGGEDGRYIEISNTDYSIILACIECCSLLNYNHSLRGPTLPKGRQVNGKPYSQVWHFTISRREILIRVLEEVPIQSQLKQYKLRTILAMYKDKPIVRRT